MGLFNLFKKDISTDPEMTRLRDLVIICASDNDFSSDENKAIMDICRKEGISIGKLKKIFNIDPETIKDNYPTSLVEKAKYLHRLIEVMTSDKVCQPNEIEAVFGIAKTLGFTEAQTDGEIRDYCRSLGKTGDSILESYKQNR